MKNYYLELSKDEMTSINGGIPMRNGFEILKKIAKSIIDAFRHAGELWT